MTEKYLTLRLYHDPPLADLYAAVNAAQAAGATGYVLTDHHYVECLGGPQGSTQIRRSPWGWIFADRGQAPGFWTNTPAWATVEAAAGAVAATGAALWLKPHLDIKWRDPATGTYGEGGWRGFALPPAPAPWQRAYRAFLRPYVALAQATGAGLVLGCELYEVTRHLGAAWWVAQARWVRETRGFRGPLTYAANWGWGADAEYARLESLWTARDRWGRRLLDTLGIDGYFPLADDPTTDPQVLAAGWDRVKAELTPLLARVRLPLTWTELAYGNCSLCMVRPYELNAARDDAAQDACWRAARAAWPGVPVWAWARMVGNPEAEITMDPLRTADLSRIVFGEEHTP